MTQETPLRWFGRATSIEPTDHTVASGGADIHYLAWGPVGAPGLVFVHGGAAHAHWWSFLVPLLADDHRVVALDLSGHGDSDRRPEYTLDAWCDEVLAVADDADMAPDPVVVGHSMGGFVSIATAARHGDRLTGIVILDSPVSKPDPEVEASRRGKLFANRKVYADFDDAVARFRTVPEQAAYVPHVLDWVARHSLTLVDPGDAAAGWTWKFDPEIFVPPRSATRDLLDQVGCRVALFRAEDGLVTPDIGAYMYERLGRRAPVVEIPQAGHHMMLDQPLSLLTGLRTLLADWDHSRPAGPAE
ncbi:MAG: alpha/beta hydrolase [Microthrixaceae bacterium]|nr:alpha/beta hydrolase [Microthrixaceae bacterium]